MTDKDHRVTGHFSAAAASAGPAVTRLPYRSTNSGLPRWSARRGLASVGSLTLVDFPLTFG
ncbi:hypothetical protein [Actinoplanes sp. TFC3]|uniref:hypothetical protein n=1 Tax=Actinoplanes sp. TFC3 TaxID=1710355 RepID=UPI00137B0F6C|nr:hypothetical protein [Actinoplanes sp. TFC3]